MHGGSRAPNDPFSKMYVFWRSKSCVCLSSVCLCGHSPKCRALWLKASKAQTLALKLPLQCAETQCPRHFCCWRPPHQSARPFGLRTLYPAPFASKAPFEHLSALAPARASQNVTFPQRTLVQTCLWAHRNFIIQTPSPNETSCQTLWCKPISERSGSPIVWRHALHATFPLTLSECAI